MNVIYKLRKINDAVRPIVADGVALEWYNGEWHNFGGWEEITGKSYPKHFHSTTGKESPWPQLPDAPWEGVHTFGHSQANGKIIIWIGELQQSWAYDSVNKWVKIGDWINGPAKRGHYGWCIHNGYAYISCGDSLDSSQTFYDLWRSPKTDLVKWEKVCDLPLEMQGWNSHILISFYNKLTFLGGGKYGLNGTTISPPYLTNTKIFQSPDDGKAFAKIIEDPLLNSFWWGNAIVVIIGTEQYIVAVSGSDEGGGTSVTNNNRIII